MLNNQEYMSEFQKYELKDELENFKGTDNEQKNSLQDRYKTRYLL